MAETPNNDIEKQLQDYAQQRRDAIGTPELHPATRQMLQAEVKQRLGNAGTTQAPTELAGWTRFWPRLAFALGVVAILGVAAILIFPPGNKAKDNLTLAKLEEATPNRVTSDKLEAAPTLAPAAMPAASAPPAPVRREVAAKSAGLGAPTADAYAMEESARRDVATARKEPAKAFKGGAPLNTPKESPAVNLATASGKSGLPSSRNDGSTRSKPPCASLATCRRTR